MGSLLVAVFSDESEARGGAGILRALHAEGTLTLYASAILSRARGAGLVVREPVEEGAAAAAPAVGAAIGALVSLLGGPLTMASRTVASGLVGAVRDLDEAGLDAAFLERISRSLQPGGGAIVAEIEEERQVPLDARLLAQSGRIFRCRLPGALAEERIVREVSALRNELAGLRGERSDAEHAGAQRKVRHVRSREMRQALRRARAQADALRREGAAKVMVLRAQAAEVQGPLRTAIEHRATTVRAGLEARAARLDRIIEAAVLPRSGRAATDRRLRNSEGDS